MNRNWKWAIVFTFSVCITTHSLRSQESAFDNSGRQLPGTQPLEMQGDIASQMVDGIDRFLLRKIEETVQSRIDHWPKRSNLGADNSNYVKQTDPIRDELKQRIGLIDKRVDRTEFLIQSRPGSPTEVAESDFCKVHWVRWNVFEGVDAEGLLLTPKNSPPRFTGLLIPDAGSFPEDYCIWNDGVKESALSLVSQGGMIVIPSVISRHQEARNGRAKLTDQEFLYRSAFELGRHILGYQVQETLAAVDILKRDFPKLPTVVLGWGEGGWIALHAAAVDTRIDAACISGHFGPRERTWNEPIHRNVHGLLNNFGDAQLAALIAPRFLVVDPIPGPSVELTSEGGAPGSLQGPTVESAKSEVDKAKALLASWKWEDRVQLAEVDDQVKNDIGRPAIRALLKSIQVDMTDSKTPYLISRLSGFDDRTVRRLRTLSKWDRWNQRLLEKVASERVTYWNKLDTSSLEKFQSSVELYRRDFREELIGAWNEKPLPFHARSRKIYDKPTWEGYEVVLDLFPDVFAYGILLVPRDVRFTDPQPASKRPCVVFQHGLEGRPQDVIEGDNPAYHDVAAKLVEQGYIVFAPQNCYLFKDRFRTLQRKSNLLGRTLFSTMVGQHQQIVDWLGTLPAVDSKRIGFYGLSYGGKSAMRIPALVDGYSLSICSADFNDWIWKNASTNNNYSYVWTGEYEIFEFGLGPKFNYAEMATLIAPRPFMVERGHLDGVAPDDRVGSEFAKVRNFYTTKLKMPERTEIEWFFGPHTVHGKGTFEFLKKHLGPIRN